ncbi:MAG: hypothetical protein GC150_04180 [Rhizobiales bacterium]|nr:hypothetical protein [Hyphomicrobiales bacterium]
MVIANYFPAEHLRLYLTLYLILILGQGFVGLIDGLEPVVAFTAVLREPGVAFYILAHIVPASMAMFEEADRTRLAVRIRTLYATGEAAFAAGQLEALQVIHRRVRILEAEEYRLNGLLRRTSRFLLRYAIALLFIGLMFAIHKASTRIDGAIVNIDLAEVVHRLTSRDHWRLFFFFFAAAIVSIDIDWIGMSNPLIRGEAYAHRLKRLIDSVGKKSPPKSPERPRTAENLAAAAMELFGLQKGFTAAQLRRAWLRIAFELHPDRHMNENPDVRIAKEEALKRVNAARDLLVGAAA